MKPSRFFINFVKALGVFALWGLGAHLVFKFLKAYAMWLEPYSGWIVLGLLVICICALAAFLACDMEDLK